MRNTGETIDTALADELWMEFYTKKGRGWLAVRSGSMAPLIQPRDRVLISPVAVEQICCGDIMVFKRNGSLIVHRVLKKLRNDQGVSFIEKGDNSAVSGTFSSDEVVGRVTMVKGNSSIFSLNSPVSRLASHALSVWFYSTSAIVTRLKSSPSKYIRRTGRVLRRLSLWSSRILVRICCIVWYLSGLRARKSIL